MRVIGKMIKRMEKELSIMQMGTFTQGIGRMIRLMAGENILMTMGQLMRENGKKINRMGKARRLGQMERSI